MKTETKTSAAIELEQLSSVTGGVAWGSMIDSIRKYIPSPTIPLGPFYPPRPDDRRIA